ncbi:hypothetical protein RBSH_03740 [Rhodopirellula baltica SH28]|uniref:Uncharacterized protein n=2 Tax=Rhodopirellula baltica TaxID=265606 RepID=F2AYZ2_RHOBT|nr:hypothetical protein RBWH47_04669 [Rhodopirellula baltica WH47]EKK01066.1 hypothetical protein RBSH_03740 [Rhodopirellula baltica SH28]
MAVKSHSLGQIRDEYLVSQWGVSDECHEMVGPMHVTLAWIAHHFV